MTRAAEVLKETNMTVEMKCTLDPAAFDVMWRMREVDYTLDEFHRMLPPLEGVTLVGRLESFMDRQSARMAELEALLMSGNKVIFDQMTFISSLTDKAAKWDALQQQLADSKAAVNDGFHAFAAQQRQQGTQLADAIGRHAESVAQREASHHPVSGVTVYGLPPVEHEWKTDHLPPSGLLTEAEQDKRGAWGAV